MKSRTTFVGSLVGVLRRAAPDRTLWVPVAVMVTSLLACEGCPSPGTEMDGGLGNAPVPPGACELSAMGLLEDSVGTGPVQLRGTDAGMDLLFQGQWDGDATLRLSRLDPTLAAREAPAPVQDPQYTGLTAGALAADGDTTIIVGRHSGGRRFQFFGHTAGSGFEPIDMPIQPMLDRRTDVILIEPRSGAGTQLVAHTSGTGEIRIGRVAGGLIVSRVLDVPTQLSPLAATAGPSGGLLLLGAESRPDGARVIAIRSVGADARLGGHATIGILPNEARGADLALVPAGDDYIGTWRVETGGDAAYRVAEINPETMQAREVGTVTGELGIPSNLVATSDGGQTLLVWSEHAAAPDGEGAVILGSFVGPAGLGPVFPVQGLENQRIDSLAVAPMGDQWALAGRVVGIGAADGPVMAASLSCQ